MNDKERLNWPSAQATVLDCELVKTSGFDEFYCYVAPEYKIWFSYEVEGETQYDYRTCGYPLEISDTFEIAYDPKNPEHNTFTAEPLNLRQWIIAGVVACPLVLLLEWVWNRVFPSAQPY